MKRFLLPSFLILSACASAPPAPVEPAGIPSWVNHPEQSYPGSRYWVSIGIGNSRDEATRDARRQMAETFLVRVKSNTQVNAGSSLSEKTSGEVSGNAEQNVEKKMDFESTARLRGAEIKEVAQSGKDTYVLLALDKLAARSGLLQESNQLKIRLDAEMDSLEASFSASKMNEARKDLASFRELAGESAALGMSALVDPASVESRMARLENSVRSKNEKKMFTLTTLKGDELFARSLEICLQDQGASVYTGEALPAGVNRVQVSVIERPEHQVIEGWVKIRYEVTANLISPDGRSYRVSENRVETARSREAGLAAATDEISKSLCDQIWNRMSEMK